MHSFLNSIMRPFFSVFLSFMFFNVLAQESPHLINLDWDHERHAWSAFWISPSGVSVNDYGVFLFRNSFDIEDVPDSLNVYVSADNRYRLYVNNHPVSSGPARGSLMYWRYETLNIAPFLKQGINTISAEVINFGEHRPAAQFSHQTAFILQSELLGDLINTGTSDWKVKKDDSYHARTVTSEMTSGKYYVAGPCDSIVASKHPWGWKEVGYNDKGWQKSIIIQKGVGRGYMHGTPWMLVPRNIPFMEEKVIRFTIISRKGSTDANNQFITGNDPITIPPNTMTSILLDQTYLTIGYPIIITSKGENSQVKITYSEALYDDTGKKGNRNEIEGKTIQGYSDIILPDGGDERLIKTTWLRTYRYVQIDIETKDNPLVIEDFYGIYTAYPFKQKASFSSTDSKLTDIWEVGWRTAQLCAGETYMDCPYWEQLQYLGDTRIQALISLNVSGDDRLMKNAIKQADRSRIPEGLTLSRGPSYIPQIIPSFSLYWIAMVHDYYMYREDDAFIKSCLPGIQAVLAWFERRMDTNDMLGGLDWFNFSDWTEGFACGAPSGVDQGNSALVSLNFVYALDRASELFAHFGKNMEADRYKKLADQIRSGVYQNCWNDTKKLMADTPEKNNYSQHTNIFSILTDCIKDENTEDLMDQILNNESLIQTTIYYKFYLFQSLQKTGLADIYLPLLKPWETMLNEGLTTFAEGDYKDRSDCHAWSASPLYDLIATVGGIKPGSPGFRSVLIEPALGSLSELNISMPHPKGEIQMDLIRNGNKLDAEVVLPEELSGEFRWLDKKIILIGGKQKFSL